MKNNNTIQSPLGKAKGLGSSHHGTGHKIAHNITTLTNIPLVAWVIYSVCSLRDATYEEFTTYMSHPVSIVVAILFVVSTLKHFALELQVVYEDYISCKCLRMMKIIGMKILFLVLGLATIVSILKIAFGAGV
ncbi:MAG: succinate dehydrogenase, hydrophobic membrane anchor protein [Alphaproteobacteria bacterium]|nr:succinate dehydrogenase, hydrophobic membrane anchor protein [Alphaproteobacteria bacterium]